MSTIRTYRLIRLFTITTMYLSYVILKTWLTLATKAIEIFNKIHLNPLFIPLIEIRKLLYKYECTNKANGKCR